MTVTPSGAKIAILVANGFAEAHMTTLQRAFTRAELPYAVISPEQGLVNSWQNNSWGHYFTVDISINTALGSDYEALAIPGGERSLAKLRTNPHAKRIVNHFLEAEKPIVAVSEGIGVMALSAKSNGLCVAAVDSLADIFAQAAIKAQQETKVITGQIVTATDDALDSAIESCVEIINAHFAMLASEANDEMQQEAA